MTDLKNRIYELTKERQMSSFATVTEEGKPWVRYVMIHGSPDLTIRFSSFVTSRKIKHLGKNSEVHITCGITNQNEAKPYLQIQGRAHMTTDKAERDAFWCDDLKNIFSGPDDPNYSVVIVEPYRIELWDFGKETEIWEK
ncbi:pyridoxamine 5'-phosphate oxidase family protein [bacterium]|nr:pyridoxamine 5'-phosphate oxidase family protein [bacterium]